MKLSPRDAAQFFRKPDTSLAGLLIYGPDAMRIALKRQDLIATLIGPDGADEMRLMRMSGADLRKDPAALNDAVKATGFFPGQRVVLVEDASDKQNKEFEAALSDWKPGDAMIIVTSGALPARAALRKSFEAARNAGAIAIYSDPPGREEVEAELSKAGLSNFGPGAMDDLATLARTLDTGDFRQTLEKLALYKLDEDTALSHEDIAACAPRQGEAVIDDAVNFIAEGNVAALGPQMHRLAGQGVNPTTLCITATRHFQALHAATASSEGIETAFSRARPPVFGPRRDRMVRQARNWGSGGAEAVLTILMDTDLALRSARPVPAMAMVERAFIRIAMMHRS